MECHVHSQCMFQADVVAQTKITYPPQELIQLIHKYLESRGSYYQTSVLNNLNTSIHFP